MKRIDFTLIVVLLATLMSSAQPGRNMDPEKMAQRQTERLKEVLSLNEKQEKEVYNLSLENSKKRAKIFKEMHDSGSNFESIRGKMTELRSEENTEMKKLLTEEQWIKYEKFLEERKQRMSQQRGGEK